MLSTPALARLFCSTVLDALFPVHPAERAVLAMSAGRAYLDLPRAPRPPIGEACSVFAYKDERVSRLVWAVKYKKSRPGAALAGYALWRMLGYFRKAMPGDMRIVVVPMPVTRSRRRERGFNQCELIVDEVEKLDDGRLIFERDLLVRTRHTSRQTMKDREGRLESMKDVFAVNEKALKRLVENKSTNTTQKYFVVVIDDVITTGATIKQAVDTLRAAGFENAYGLSVAH